MANGYNRVILFGNLGADPELRMTQNGRAVLTLRLATSQSYLDANRVRQERTEWHSVSVWGKRAEALAKLLSKGQRVFVEGELRTRSWDADDGSKRYRTDVVATEILFGFAAARAGGGGGGGGDDYERSEGEYDPNDDIPF